MKMIVYDHECRRWQPHIESSERIGTQFFFLQVQVVEEEEEVVVEEEEEEEKTKPFSNV